MNFTKIFIILCKAAVGQTHYDLAEMNWGSRLTDECDPLKAGLVVLSVTDTLPCQSGRCGDVWPEHF